MLDTSVRPKLTVVLPFHQKDAGATGDLLEWIGRLGGARNNPVLLVADAATQWTDCKRVLELARTIFKDATLTVTAKPVVGWPAGSNALFRHAAMEMDAMDSPWLWLEPDTIPLKTGWLDAIQSAYDKANRKFMGRIYASNSPRLPKHLMSGIGVYPADTLEIVGNWLESDRAWDVAIADVIVPQAADTPLVQWFWGQPGLAPTFAASKNGSSPINTFTLDSLEPDAVLFHRNKDGTLLRLLGHKPGTPLRTEFIQLGRSGDLILLLPAFMEIFKSTGTRPTVFVSEEYAGVLDGVSYVMPRPIRCHWYNGMPEALRISTAECNGMAATVLQCHGRDWGVDMKRWPNFMASMWDRAGFGIESMRRIPVVFDQRNPVREQQLVAGRTSDKPLVLFNFKGVSSPFPFVAQVRNAIGRFHGRIRPVDLGNVRAHRVYDLLGLFDAARLLITIDTATLHLAAASTVPHIAFIVDGWCGSVPKGNCKLAVRYSETIARMDEIESAIESAIQ